MSTVSDYIVRRMRTWGVTRIYGYPGDGINGVVGAIDRSRGAIEFVQPRHEEAAAFMACGHAKFTGKPGVCLATSGPGAVHLLTGLYDAKADHQPVVAIVGQKPRSALGGDFQQEIDLAALFMDVAHEYVQMITTATQARHVIDRAFRSRSRRAPPPASSSRATCRSRRRPSRRTGTARCIPARASRCRASCPRRATCNARPTCSTPASASPSWRARELFV